MKPLYVISMFYSTLKENQALVAAVKKDVEGLSGGDFHVLGFGEHSCAIGFTSDKPTDSIRAQLGRIGGETFHTICFEVASVVGGSMYQGPGQWLARRRPPG